LITSLKLIHTRQEQRKIQLEEEKRKVEIEQQKQQSAALDTLVQLSNIKLLGALLNHRQLLTNSLTPFPSPQPSVTTAQNPPRYMTGPGYHLPVDNQLALNPQQIAQLQQIQQLQCQQQQISTNQMVSASPSSSSVQHQGQGMQIRPFQMPIEKQQLPMSAATSVSLIPQNIMSTKITPEMLYHAQAAGLLIGTNPPKLFPSTSSKN
jgi:hypothetical protein